MRLDSWQDDHDERRAAPRRATRVDALLEHADGKLSGLVVDVSFAGAKFVTETTAPELELGCRAVLTITPQAAAGSEELTWSGMVVRSERSGDDGPDRIAYAIAFDEFA